ncbi:MAG: hypothetical protein HUJ53_07940 [Holdemanella sp.]|nr:hypothetical protein [Holdemanella sp.]
MSILEMYDKALDMHRTYYQYEKIEGAYRKQMERIPETAFREAIANAFVHRYWDVQSFIRISMFDDRIEIAFRAGLSEKEYLDGQVSILRNPIVGNLFFRLRYIERFGTGIKRINKTYKTSKRKPVYRVYENSIYRELPAIENDVPSLKMNDGL